MVDAENKISRFTDSPLSHYLGVAIVVLSCGLSVSISRSVRFEVGSGENSLSLHGEATKLKKEIIQHQQQVDRAKDEIEQFSEIIEAPD